MLPELEDARPGHLRKDGVRAEERLESLPSLLVVGVRAELDGRMGSQPLVGDDLQGDVGTTLRLKDAIGERGANPRQERRRITAGFEATFPSA